MPPRPPKPVPFEHLDEETQERYLDTQRYITDRFNCYRVGHKWNDQRSHIWERIKRPSPGRWRGMDYDAGLVDYPHHYEPKHRYKASEGGGAAGTDAEIAKAAERARELSQLLLPHNVSFNKIMGFGGMGIAALFDVIGDPAGPRQVVVKCDIDPDRDSYLPREKQQHKLLNRALHIVQMAKLPKLQGAKRDMPGSGGGGDEGVDDSDDGDLPPKKKQRGDMDPASAARILLALRGGNGEPEEEESGRLKRARGPSPSEEHVEPSGPTDDTEPEGPNALVLEYMPRGDLAKWMGKMAAADEDGRPPAEVLWQIFDCLFRAVIAMAYPPSLQPDYNQTGGDDGPAVFERTPPNKDDPSFDERVESEDFVHFDIDPLNILVGDFSNDNAGHSFVPLCKIADLGLATEMRPLGKTMSTWTKRDCGKKYWKTPEQFTKEWDHIPEFPATAPFKVHVAGQYGWKTNLWQVGLVMWALITLCKPRPPSQPKQLGKGEDDEGNEVGVWTYGGYLFDDEFADVDPDLKQLVVMCLCQAPYHRPDMKVIEHYLQNFDERPPSAEAVAWCQSMFSDAPRRAAHDAQWLKQWLDGIINYARFQQGPG